MDFLTLFFKGIFVGISNVIPGVSGGTIALVLGIFDNLISAVNGFFKNPKKHLMFLVPVFLGAGAGIVAFGSIIDYCLQFYSLPTCMFFAGLVLGSIPLIYKKATEKGFKSSYNVAGVISFAVVVLISMLKSDSGFSLSTEPSVFNFMIFFFCGMLGSMAMVVPGISGSFIMVLIGVYPVIIHAVSDIRRILQNPSDITLIINTAAIIIPIGLGVVAGVLLVSKLIETLLSKFYSITYFSILGLIFGSVYALFADPIAYQSGFSPVLIFAGVALMGGGFLLSLKFGK